MPEENNLEQRKADERYRQELLDTRRLLALSLDKMEFLLMTVALV